MEVRECVQYTSRKNWAENHIRGLLLIWTAAALLTFYLISVEESVSCGCYFIGSPRRINLLNLMCLPTKIQPDINKEQVLRFNRVLEIRLYMCSKGHFFSWPEPAEPLRFNLFDLLWILLIHKYFCRRNAIFLTWLDIKNKFSNLICLPFFKFDAPGSTLYGYVYQKG